MTGRPESTRAVVREYMQQATEPVTVQQVCAALGLTTKGGSTVVRRTLKSMGAKVVGSIKKAPRPHQRGGCKPARLWRLI